MRPRKVILCVDDCENILSVRKFLLETKGYKVVTALDGEAALVIFRAGGIDLVLADLIMPNMDGNELVRTVRLINPEVPTIIISGAVKTFGRADHADAFIPKGLPIEVLLDRIKALVMRKRGPKKAHAGQFRKLEATA